MLMKREGKEGITGLDFVEQVDAYLRKYETNLRQDLEVEGPEITATDICIVRMDSVPQLPILVCKPPAFNLDRINSIVTCRRSLLVRTYHRRPLRFKSLNRASLIRKRRS